MTRKTYLEVLWVEFPGLLCIQCWHIDSAWDEDISAGNGNGLQGPLNAVKDVVQDTWAQLH